MAVSEKATVGMLSQALNDHLEDCTRERKDTNRRLGRIESVMICVAGSAILQLLAICAALFVKAYH